MPKIKKIICIDRARNFFLGKSSESSNPEVQLVIAHIRNILFEPAASAKGGMYQALYNMMSIVIATIEDIERFLSAGRKFIFIDATP